MQVLRERDALYVGHYGKSGMGTTILDVSNVERPRIVEQWPAPDGTHTHKVQVGDGLLLVNEERFRDAGSWSAGLVAYDVSEPLAPRRVARHDCGGGGVHRIVWTGGRYAHASSTRRRGRCSRPAPSPKATSRRSRTASARTTSTRTAPAAIAARRSCSSRTSTQAFASTTSRTRRVRRRSPRGCRSRTTRRR